MTAAVPVTHRKHYPDGASRRRAEANYRWLASLGSPLRLPRLLTTGAKQLGFEPITGRHALPADLHVLAAHLGQVHAAAYRAGLHQARLGEPFVTPSGHLIPGFLTRRLAAVTRALASGAVPGAAFTTAQAQRLLRGACAGAAAFYKDANPRNFLLTPAGPVTVDFDDLSLAPFGYDLAKLTVTLAMTHGPLPAWQITAALDAYNTATATGCPPAAAVTWERLMTWAEIHHILTSRYRNGSGYQHSWHDLRPCQPPRPADLEE